MNSPRFTGGDGLKPGTVEYAFHRALMANELHGGYGAYQVANAGRALSGPSFGPFQYDVGSNAKARQVLEQIARAALDTNGRRIIDDKKLALFQSAAYQPFSSMTQAQAAIYAQLKPQFDAALASPQGQALLNATYPQDLRDKIKDVDRIVAAVADPENRRFMQGSVLARLIIADTRNQYGTAVNAGLVEFVNRDAGDAAMPMPGRATRPEAIGVRGEFGLEELVRYKLETAYAQTQDGAQDALRRIANLVNAVGVQNIPLSAEDRQFFAVGLNNALRENGIDPGFLRTDPQFAPLRALGGDAQALPPDPMADGVLRHGETGAAVIALQRRLAVHGIRQSNGQPIPASGNYLDLTQAAVRQFQQQHAITPTGVADAATLAALAKPPIPMPQPQSFDQVMHLMLPPLDGKGTHVTYRFGAAGHVNTGTHRGVDFNYVGGQAGPNLRHPSVHSPVSGEVVALDPTWGLVRIKDALGNLHEIQHLEPYTVRKGQHVQAGQPIGRMGDVGYNITGNHVHYQLVPAGASDPVNPVDWWNNRPSPAASLDPLVDNVLQTGEHGAAVTRIQQQLTAHGLRGANGTPLGTDGVFDVDVAAAVRAFQRTYDLPVTGIADKATRVALARPPVPDPLADNVLKPGEQGPTVVRIQQQLTAQGFRGLDGKRLGTDGQYDADVTAAVRAFQASHGLPVTGIADKATRVALAGPPAIRFGDTGAHVAHVQHMLRAAGIDVPATGTFNYQTQGAVKDFQVANKLPPTGEVSGDTLYLLRQAEQRVRAGASVTQPAHPDHALFNAVLGGVHGIDNSHGRTSDQRSINLAAAATAAAREAGLERADRVLLSNDGARLFVVQALGQGDARRSAHVDTALAIGQPVEASTRMLDVLRADTPHARAMIEQVSAPGFRVA